MSHFLGLAAAFAAIEVAQGNAGIMLRWYLLHAIDCVPHARPPRRRYLRMVGFRVFDYVYKYVRPYIVFVPGLTMYKHLRTFRCGDLQWVQSSAPEVASTFSVN